MILYSISYSPWSLRAKWALDLHDVEYDDREFIPMLSEPYLKARFGVGGKLTVPLLVDDGEVFRDSYDIARHADDRYGDGSLFSDEEACRAWAATADELADAGRAITTFAVLRDRDAVRENVPDFVPRPIRPFATPLVHLGAQHLSRKYDFDPDRERDARTVMRAALERIANRLVARPFLGGDTFGFSDIAVASALQFVRPHATWGHLGPASALSWTRDELAGDFEDVLDWRDQLLAEHRPD